MAELELAEMLARASATTLLVIILIGIFRGWIVTRLRHEEATGLLEKQLHELGEDRDFWRSIALQSLEVTRQAVTDPPKDDR
jgi:uncharacterized membrane protein YqjE